MPEGHTIHRAARLQSAALAGAPVTASSPQGRFADGASLLDGRVLQGIEAVGKHLIYRFEDEVALHVHLGLFGRFDTHRNRVPDPRGSVRLRLAGHAATVDLRGPTTCEIIDLPDEERLMARLGPDPLRADADPERAWQRISRSRRAIGALLMDQSVLAGVGNVYRAEALHVEGLHPEREGRSLSRDEFDRLWTTIRGMLRDGERAGRIITVSAADAGVPRSRIPRGQRTYVYRQRQCRSCGAPVRAWEMARRRAWACEQCQL